jgi:hypothetical protein
MLKPCAIMIASVQPSGGGSPSLRRTVRPNAGFSALGGRKRPNIDFLGHPFRKFRPAFGKQELRNVIVPDRTGSLWRIRDMLEATGNGLSLQQIAQGHEGALPASPSCPFG